MKLWNRLWSVEDFHSEHEALIVFFEENHIEYLERGLGH